MDVEVHKAGKDIHPFGVQFVGRVLGASFFIDGNKGCPHTGHPDDLVVLDNNIDGTTGRAACAVDKGTTANDEPLKGTLSLIASPVWGGVGPLSQQFCDLLWAGVLAHHWKGEQDDCKQNYSMAKIAFIDGHMHDSLIWISVCVFQETVEEI
jgi:hypothetical protein